MLLYFNNILLQITNNWYTVYDIQNFSDQIKETTKVFDTKLMLLKILQNTSSNPIFCLKIGNLEDRGIAAWQSDEEVEESNTTSMKYMEGKEIYEIPLPPKVKQWHGWKYVPFMPAPKQKKRERSLSGQWSRRKSLVAGIGNSGY